jgi:hypothetical protein
MTSATLGTRITLIEKKWLDIGLKVRGTYLTGNRNPITTLPIYNVVSQTSAVSNLESQGAPRQTGLILDAGPELDISIVKGLVLSTGISAGYTSITNKAFSVNQTLN